MNILMFGWEFPPIKSGGLGVACHGIVDGLVGNGHNVYLVLPKTDPKMQMWNEGQFKAMAAHESGGVVNTTAIPSTIYSPYATSESAIKYVQTHKAKAGQSVEAAYGQDLMEQVHNYAGQAAVHAEKTPHDVIHTHDWLTAEAGIQAKKISEKPMVMHVHATEFDRSGENPNQAVYDLEKRGMENADRVIAVSAYTKKMLEKHYGVPDWKIDVVHNAVAFEDEGEYLASHHINKKDKVVLFLGRMTMQKGPDYFLQMARKVINHMDNVKFIMAGDGDMMEKVIEMAVDLGIERHVLFSGFLTGKEVSQAYRSADLYVMPSVSEPFGIAPLEAIRNGAPVLISKQSGVSEVIKNALRADFWDIDDMANKAHAVLSYDALGSTLRKHAGNEVEKMSWLKQTKHMVASYLKAHNPKHV